MKFHKKVASWFVDYGYMAQGAALSVIHHTPPKHYLEFRVAGKVPVILIPGILGRWSFMKRLGDKISLEGHPVCSAGIRDKYFQYPYFCKNAPWVYNSRFFS